MSMAPYRQAAVRAARRHGIPTQLFKKLIDHESGWQAEIESKAGAVGLTQLMPDTAAYLKVNPRNPIANLDGGARYLREQYDRFGSWRLALAAYNAGPGNVENGEWKTFPETQHYVSTILGPNPRTMAAAPAKHDTPAPAAPLASLTPPAALAPLGQSSGFTPSLGSSGLFGTDTVSEAIFQGLGQVAQGRKATDTLTDVLATPTYTPPPALAPASAASGGVPENPITPPPRAAPARDGTVRKPPSGVWLKPGAQLIGSPHSGTHTIGNWQSDNAVDIKVPTGTPVYAPTSGKLGNTGFLPGQGSGSSGRFAGERINLYGGGQGFYFAHLSKLAPGISQGAAVKKGQLLGYTGSANGVEHLHFGVEHGSPYDYYDQS